MNSDLIREFTILIEQTESRLKDEKSPTEKNKNSFRLKMFRNFLKILKKYPDTITSKDQLNNMSNVGKGIKDRVEEILKTGKLKEIKRTKDIKEIENKIDAMDSLLQVIGIGESKAKELIKKGIKSAEDLKKKVNSGKISVNSKIELGLKYYGVVKTKIPREEMNKIGKLLLENMIKVSKKLVGTMCGSYRRQLPTSNDIDFLLTHPLLKTEKDVKSESKNYLRQFVNQLYDEEFLLDDMTSRTAKTKYMGFCRLGKSPVRRIDIRFVPYDSYYSALLYFTGSGVFNQKMRQKAIKLGYKLNEYGLYKESENEDGEKKYKRIKIGSEQDIFEGLDMEYVEPKYRT